MAWIQERKDKNGKIKYTALIRIKGFPPMSATFDRKTDAKIWVQENESKMKVGKHIKGCEAKKHTLGELIDKYISEELPKRKTNQGSFKAQLLWWKNKIGAYTLNLITPCLLAKYRDVLASEPNSRATKSLNEKKSNATVNRYIACLSIVLTKAYKELEWIDENPMLKVDKLKEPKGRTRFLSKEEQQALLQACQQSKSPLLYLLVVLALSTGARHGELINITWNNVVFKNASGQVSLRLMNTKNGEHRTITIDGLGYELLKQHSKIRKINSKFVFARPDGQKPYDLRKQWEHALEVANIKDFRFHDLRHTTASNLAMNGASLRDIAEITGHKTMQMVQRYSHLTEKYSTRVLSDLNNKQFDDMDLGQG